MSEATEAAIPTAGAAALPSAQRRQVFVAYPYSIPKADYRKPFEAVGKAFNVKFVFADEKISNLHILDKIKGYIVDSAFGIYDITAWNPNVALELGLALGLNRTAYIAFDPSKTNADDVPTDLRGMDRLQYSSFSDLEARIEWLIAQELPLPRTHDAENQLEGLRETVLALVAASEGLKIGDIAKAVGVSTDLAKVVVRPLVAEDKLRVQGVKRGAKYHAAD
jgi:predicted nucleotide-binding protein